MHGSAHRSASAPPLFAGRTAGSRSSGRASRAGRRHVTVPARRRDVHRQAESRRRAVVVGDLHLHDPGEPPGPPGAGPRRGPRADLERLLLDCCRRSPTRRFSTSTSAARAGGAADRQQAANRPSTTHPRRPPCRSHVAGASRGPSRGPARVRDARGPGHPCLASAPVQGFSDAGRRHTGRGRSRGTTRRTCGAPPLRGRPPGRSPGSPARPGRRPSPSPAPRASPTEARRQLPNSSASQRNVAASPRAASFWPYICKIIRWRAAESSRPEGFAHVIDILTGRGREVQIRGNLSALTLGRTAVRRRALARSYFGIRWRPKGAPQSRSRNSWRDQEASPS